MDDNNILNSKNSSDSIPSNNLNTSQHFCSKSNNKNRRLTIQIEPITINDTKSNPEIYINKPKINRKPNENHLKKKNQFKLSNSNLSQLQQKQSTQKNTRNKIILSNSTNNTQKNVNFPQEIYLQTQKNVIIDKKNINIDIALSTQSKSISPSHKNNKIYSEQYQPDKIINSTQNILIQTQNDELTYQKQDKDNVQNKTTVLFSNQKNNQVYNQQEEDNSQKICLQNQETQIEIKNEKDLQQNQNTQETSEQKITLKKPNRYNLKGLFGVLIDEMNPMIIVILSFFTFMISTSRNYTLDSKGSLLDTSLYCHYDTSINQCVQEIPIQSLIQCVDNVLLNYFMFFRSSGDIYCLENGDYTSKYDPNTPSVQYDSSQGNDRSKFEEHFSQYLYVICQIVFFCIILIAMIIHTAISGKYGSGKYILYSLRLEYIPLFRYSVLTATLIFVILIFSGTIYFMMVDQAYSFLSPIISFTVLLVIQFRYMLLKRQLWIDVDHPEFQNAQFKRHGFIEYICSNNFIYFNAIERAVIQDIKNNNHDNLSAMLEFGSPQAIQNILVNRPVDHTNESPNYFKVYQLTQEQIDSQPKKIHWQSILFIITNEFRELLTIFVQVYFSTIELQRESVIKGSDPNLDCHLQQNQQQECKTTVNISQYYHYLNEYTDQYFTSMLFQHENGHCKDHQIFYGEEYNKRPYYEIGINEIFIVVKILLYSILLSTIALMVYLVKQYIQEKSGNYNTGQFLTFCLKIDQSISFKKYAKLLLVLYIILNGIIAIIFCIYGGTDMIFPCIFSTFSVFSEFRQLIWNPKMSQNIEHPAFQEAILDRGGISWFLWIYSDKYFNYLELAAQQDLSMQGKLYSNQNEDQIIIAQRSFNSQQQKYLSSSVKHVRRISNAKKMQRTEKENEIAKLYPNLSQYILKGDIEKIAKILTYQL